VINALLRTEALERSTMPYQAELAMAVSAMIFHSFLPEWHLVEPTDWGITPYSASQHRLLQCTISITLFNWEIRFAVPPYARER
jgi:hypothetical protein